MVKYHGELLVTPVPGRRFYWCVKNRLSMTWRREVPWGEKVYIADTFHLPELFVTNFASVPRAFWNIFPPHDGLYILPSVWHDYFYESHVVKKNEADEFFYVAMRQHGVSFVKAQLMYTAVRWFGSWAWEMGPKRKKDRCALAERCND